MLLTHNGSLDAIAEFFTVLIIFAFVLAITYFTTRWIANYQKGKKFSKNIQVIETYKITTNKYLQIVKMGDKYLAIALCKDTVSFLTELEESQIDLAEDMEHILGFKEILEKAKKFTSGRRES